MEAPRDVLGVAHNQAGVYTAASDTPSAPMESASSGAQVGETEEWLAFVMMMLVVLC